MGLEWDWNWMDYERTGQEWIGWDLNGMGMEWTRKGREWNGMGME